MKKKLDVESAVDLDKGKVKVFGNPDTWKLLCKASNESEGWMKSTKVLELEHGCLVQVSTQQHDNVAKAITYVPDVKFADFSK